MLETTHSTRRVPAEGPKDAKIIFVGESPGRTEEIQGRPFVGEAGQVLDNLLQQASILRESAYITNVVKYRPPGNNFNYYKKTRPDLLEAGIAEVRKEIEEIKPNLIVPLGAEALEALTGLKGISKWRGSVLWSELLKCKILPTYHPALILREWEFYGLAKFDLKKAAMEAAFPEHLYVEPEILLAPSMADCSEAFQKIRQADYASFDIEVMEHGIDCISFAWDNSHAISIPFSTEVGIGSYWPERDELSVWRQIRDIFLSDIPMVAQNGMYDMFQLKQKLGITVKNYWLDTMYAFNQVYPSMPKSLDVLASLYTDIPYWGEAPKKMGPERWNYNAMDSIVTYRLITPLLEELTECGQSDFYFNHTHKLITPLLGMSLTGVRMDKEFIATEKVRLKGEVKEHEEALNGLAGKELNAKSPKQLIEYLYKGKGLPPQYTRAARGNPKRITTNEDALKKLKRKYPLKELDLILDIRQKQKLISTYLDNLVGEDGRAHCSYNLAGTESGRLSSSAAPDGSGTNLQNIPPLSPERFLGRSGYETGHS